MSKNTSFRLACVQMCSGLDPAQNLATAARLIDEAVQRGAEVVMTPEVTNIVAPWRKAADRVETLESDASAAAFAGLARQHAVYLLAGSFALKSGDRLVNRSLLFGPDGTVFARYDKMHMFDVELDGGESYRESRGYRPGDRAVVADLPWLRLGMTVCYDMRFPALHRHLAQAGAGLISVPAAFTRPTGQAHWEVLLRARAIETGCFIAAPAQTGVHESGRKTYGHSLIVDPWGTIVAEAGDEDGVILADIDPAACDAARRRVPSLDHDRAFGLNLPSGPMRAAS